jgi:hypothetical protein
MSELAVLFVSLLGEFELADRAGASAGGGVRRPNVALDRVTVLAERFESV